MSIVFEEIKEGNIFFKSDSLIKSCWHRIESNENQVHGNKPCNKQDKFSTGHSHHMYLYAGK